MKGIQELLNLSGKAAIVTGGAQGIGYGISYRLAEAGAHVLVTDINTSAAQKTANDLVAKGWSAKAYIVDVGQGSGIQGMIEECHRTFGSLDILVNNAGIYPVVALRDMTAERFEEVLRVNLLSAFMATKYAAEIMRAQGGGKIINITSIDALHPSMTGLSHYDASKHGMWGFTQSSALELAPDNIQVNAIAPGGIATPGTGMGGQATAAQTTQAQAFAARIPMGRMGEPDDIGSVALFLTSDMARYITGAQIVVDGGALLK